MFHPENAQNEIQFLNRTDVQIRSWNSLNLRIPPTVYPPREDTDLLLDVLDSITPFGSKNLLEIGSGSGALSIYAAKHGWNTHACDINPYAVAATRFNAQEAGVVVEVTEGGIGPSGEGQSLHAWNSGTYDVVLWNMPYIPAEEAGEQLLGPLEEAALIDTHPEGLLSVFAESMASNKLCRINGMALLVCRGNVGWKRSVDILRQKGLAARIVRTKTFDDEEAIHVIASWHPFVSNKHHHMREIDSTNAELLRGQYSAGDSLTASIQTSGRGRHGNDWQDHPNSFKGSWMLDSRNIVSIDLRKQLLVAHEIAHALRLNEQHIHQLNIKWPNDLLLRVEGKDKWRKVGGILFQSYSKGDEQRIVLGIGLNTDAEHLEDGQGSLGELGIGLSTSELYPLLNAIVASLFEDRLPQIGKIELPTIDSNIVLSKCIYRNKQCQVKAIKSSGIVLADGQENQYTISDDDEVEWINLHLQ